MSYAKNTWQTGDVVTAEKLNRMEEGIETASYNPVLANAKTTGGFGYTEQGEQTVITWDGDTEGRDNFTLNFGLGEVSYYKVSEKSDNYTDSAVVGFADTDEREAVKSDGNGAFMYWDGESILVVVADGGDFSLYNGVITGDAPSAGVYFMNFAQAEVVVSSLTYGTPDTIHTIDEKYLPASGGVVIIEIDPDTGEPSIPKTEINALVSSGVVVFAKIQEATIPMVCDGVYGKMEFFGFVGASFSDDGKLNYADVYDVFWDEATNSFIVNSGWSEFGA